MCRAEEFLSGGEMMAAANSIYRAKFSGQRVCEREDLVAEGVLGIIRAGERYDESKGKFLTYAWKAAYRSMLSLVIKEGKNVDCRFDFYDEDVLGCADGEKFVNAFDDEVDKLRDLNKKNNSILNDLLDFKSQVDVAKRHGVTVQRVSKVFCDFKEDVLAKFEMRNGEIREKG